MTVADYITALDPAERAIAEVLVGRIRAALPDATERVYHRHPAFFLEGNPVVGFAARKNGMTLLFWSGQSFPTGGLEPEGSFQAAEVVYSDVADIDAAALDAWLADARSIQWDYEHIRTNKGLVKRTAF